jgi:pilus assembly protein CpaB
MRRLLFPLFAVVMAATVALVVNAWLEDQQRAALASVQAVTVVAEPRYIEVLVAAERLTPGSFVKPSALRWQTWPDVELPRSYLVRGRDDATAFEGSVVRQLLTPGDPILADNLIRPGDRGFLAAVLDPDMRAVSVPVDEASSNAGLILPGDRVDLILTQTVGSPGERAVARRVSETVLENLRVIAMGRRLHTDPEDDIGTGPIRTTTLEVSPEGAEVVALVTELGKLSLSLRSIARSSGVSAAVPSSRRAVTWDSDISQVLGRSGRPTAALTVMRGATSERLQAVEGSTP